MPLASRVIRKRRLMHGNASGEGITRGRREEFLCPAVMTSACERFVKGAVEVINLFGWVFGIADIADIADGNTESEFLKFVEASGIRINKTAILHGSRRNKGNANQMFRPVVDRHERLIAEMLLCRQVDNFLTYLAELMSLVFHHRPEMLRSDEKVSAKDVLNHQTIGDFAR
jgi:hypothetical protein